MKINIFQPQLGIEELNAIWQVFKSNWIGRGTKTIEFEKEFASHIHVIHNNIMSISSCTNGLFLIMEHLNLTKEDEVIIPTISFVGASNAVKATGAKLVFCDVNKLTLNPDIEHIKEKTTKNTKAIILIHYGGVPINNFYSIIEFCMENNITVIEDNACSPVSTINGNYCGTLADYGVWSFDSMKILVTGDGGMIHSSEDNINILKKKAYLGLDTTSGYVSDKNKWWEFDIIDSGNRLIINDITAAIGIEQLKKINGFIDKRKVIYDTYTEHLSKLEWLKVPDKLMPNVTSSYYLYWIQCDCRDRLATYLKNLGIYTTFRYYPLHKVRYYNDNSHLPNSDYITKSTLCLPLHQALTKDEVEFVIDKITEFKDV